MKKLLILVVIAVGAIAAFRYWDKSQEVTLDRSRVADMLEAVRDGDEQRAMSLWAEGKYMLDMEGLKRYANEYPDFVRASGLAGGTSWEIADVQRNEENHESTITVTRDSRRVVLRVRKYVPIELVSAD